ncbi:MAG: hypothetical protein AB7R00_30870 [Kofleriaceae bacterium]
MKLSGWCAGIVLASTLMTAAADGIRNSSNNVFYIFPQLVQGGWNHKTAGKDNRINISEEPGHTPPELAMVELGASRAGTVEEVEKAIPVELQRDGVTFFGQKVTGVKLAGDGKSWVVKPKEKFPELYGTVNVRAGTATVNGMSARYAVTKVEGAGNGVVSIVVLAQAKGAEQRGGQYFDGLLKSIVYIKSKGEQNADKEAKGIKDPDPPAEKPYVPVLAPVAFVKDVTATSTFKDKKNMYAPWRVFEFEDAAQMPGDLTRPKTAWCEGKPDEGIGEGITLTLASPIKLDRIEVAAGVWLTDKLFKANNRPSLLEVSFDGGKPVRVPLPGLMDWETVKVGKAVSSITIKIAGVAKGRMNDSCISGVTLWANDEQVGVLRGIDPSAAAALPKALIAIYDAIGDAKKLEPFLAYPFSVEDSSMWGFGDAPPTVHKTFKSVETACRNESAVRDWPEGKARKCPHGPNVRDDYGPSVSGNGTSVQVTFPSGREIADIWMLDWKAGAWKLSAVAFGTP